MKNLEKMEEKHRALQKEYATAIFEEMISPVLRKHRLSVDFEMGAASYITEKGNETWNASLDAMEKSVVNYVHRNGAPFRKDFAVFDIMLSMTGEVSGRYKPEDQGIMNSAEYGM